MKSLQMLLKSLLHDCSRKCGTTTTRDVSYISSRVEHEGLSFLTITLPEFCSDFERSLEQGSVDPSFFRSFRKNGAIPCLFSGMLGQVFDKSGKLLPEPSIVAISCIRQVSLLLKKVELPCSDFRRARAVAGYLAVEQELRERWPQVKDSELFRLFGLASDIVWCSIARSKEFSLDFASLVPRHGPGAVAEKKLPNQKFSWSQWHQRLEPFFPMDSYCYSTLGTQGLLDSIDLVPPEQELPVRVVFVPKTLKTPRVIAIEPSCVQYTQQALYAMLVRSIERGYLTRGHVNFSDQSINARLALESSKSGSHATLDLKDASDRVHHAVVSRMLDSIPLLRDAVFACRSTRATLPNGTTIPLEKFASMGSAMCFPMEAMVFYIIALLTIAQERNLPLKERTLSFCSQFVWVYGDDIVVAKDYVPAVIRNLEQMMLKVSPTKCFVEGNFRESCGTDAYLGTDVTPTYVRQVAPGNRRSSRQIVSWISLSNQLHSRGFYSAAKFAEMVVRKVYPSVPTVSETSACFGLVRGDEPLTVHRMNKQLHRPEVRGLVAVPSVQSDPISDYPALMRSFLSRYNEREKDFEYSVRPSSFTLKTRWSAVHSYGVTLKSLSL
jgi:hypothetical protein